MDTRIERITAWTGLVLKSVDACVGLLEDGNTVPFIARYRKDRTGALDEVGIRKVESALARHSELEARKKTILSAIEEQGALTVELKARIEGCWEKAALEDLYLPFKRARKTRAGVARAAGLEPLARMMLGQAASREPPLAAAIRFVSSEKGVGSAEDALAGARDIVAEEVANHPQARGAIRLWAAGHARVQSKRKRGAGEEAETWRDWFDHQERLDRAPPHRILALLRGEEQGALSISLDVDEPRALWLARDPWFSRIPGVWKGQFMEASEDGWRRLLWPAVQRELLAATKQRADEASVATFEQNLRALLMAPPVRGQRVLAVDPGFRNGCKLAVIDETGGVLDTGTVYPHPPQGRAEQAMNFLVDLVRRHRVDAVAVGDGTAHRETMALLARVKWPSEVEVAPVSEAGASVWSASVDAGEELPNMDVTLRGAVSIARRFQDPLAELVRIDPKALGVGQYQHDVDQKLLAGGLDAVVEECVNRVGVEVNTASAPLLSRVAGIGPKLARAVVAHRTRKGRFRRRAELLKVGGMGPARYTQCAGFLRIPDGAEPLDRTGIHPEAYEDLTRTARRAGTSVVAVMGKPDAVAQLRAGPPPAGIGPETWLDALGELARPGRDPRGEREVFSFRDDVHSVEDLESGMVLPGRVTNVTDFGAFVDIGVHRDGLVHISQMADRRVATAFEVCKPQQTVKVKVLEVDKKRNRISLTMRPSELVG